MKKNLHKLLKIRGVKLLLEFCLFLLIFIILQSWMQREMVDGTPPALQGRLLDGQTVNLQSLKGKPVLLHFWASWCGICKLEQNSINAINENYTVISVAMKSGEAADIQLYMDKHKLDFPVVVDADGAIAQRYGVTAVPASFIINSAGRIKFKQTGYTTSWGLRIRLWLAAR